MDTVLLGVGACMGADICHILGKSRVPLEALEVLVTGQRVETNPRRYRAIRFVFRVKGPGPEDQAHVERAVALSRETYCSAIHSLRPDLEVDIAIERG
jgi:putative redox protein